MSYENCKSHVDSICKFLSLCYGIRIEYNRFIYRTESEIYIYTNPEQIKNKHVSNVSLIFKLLKDNYRIEKILMTDWHSKFIANKSKFDKSIDNYSHSREVESSSRYLLLFNIIEIFSGKQEIEKFNFNELETLKNNNINSIEFGYSFNKLKEIRTN